MAFQVANNLRFRRSFGRIKKIIDLPYLIEIQKNSYDQFLQREVAPAQRQNFGLQGNRDAAIRKMAIQSLDPRGNSGVGRATESRVPANRPTSNRRVSCCEIPPRLPSQRQSQQEKVSRHIDYTKVALGRQCWPAGGWLASTIIASSVLIFCSSIKTR